MQALHHSSTSSRDGAWHAGSCALLPADCQVSGEPELPSLMEVQQVQSPLPSGPCRGEVLFTGVCALPVSLVVLGESGEHRESCPSQGWHHGVHRDAPACG